ncbi:MAG: hypothetical protein QXY15_10545 [Candidatus Nitrosotenuis sp.]
MPSNFGSIGGNFGVMTSVHNISGGTGATPVSPNVHRAETLPQFIKSELNNTGLPTPKQKADQLLISESSEDVAETLESSRTNPDSIHFPSRVSVSNVGNTETSV